MQQELVMGLLSKSPRRALHTRGQPISSLQGTVSTYLRTGCNCALRDMALRFYSFSKLEKMSFEPYNAVWVGNL